MVPKEHIRIRAQSDRLYREACERYNEENYERAMANLEEAVRMSPNFSSAFCLMGHCKEKQGEEENALDLYSQAIEADPYHAKAWFYKGETLNRLGQTEEGVRHIEKAVSLSFGR